MANAWDASVKLVYPADQGTNFTVDVLEPGTPFDVIADVEIGEDLNENVDDFVLRVGVVNLTTSVQVALVKVKAALIPQPNTNARDQIRADFVAVQNAANPPAIGDVLQAVASYSVRSGATKDVSTAQSATFVVVDAL